MNLYFVTRNDTYVQEILDRLNFEIVLVGNGHFPGNTCIWMGWQCQGDDSSERLYQLLDKKFDLKKLGIVPVRSTLFPENLIWDKSYGNILILGEAGELGVYMKRFLIFSTGKKNHFEILPDGFIYKMECEISDSVKEDGKTEHKLHLIERGFLYESGKE